MILVSSQADKNFRLPNAVDCARVFARIITLTSLSISKVDTTGISAHDRPRIAYILHQTIRLALSICLLSIELGLASESLLISFRSITREVIHKVYFGNDK